MGSEALRQLQSFWDSYVHDSFVHYTLWPVSVVTLGEEKERNMPFRVDQPVFFTQ